MWEAFNSDPKDLGAVLAIVAICVAVVATKAINAWRNNEAKKHDTELKMEMVARGMSADEITRVLDAKSVDSQLAETAYHKKA